MSTTADKMVQVLTKLPNSYKLARINKLTLTLQKDSSHRAYVPVLTLIKLENSTAIKIFILS